MQVCEEIMVFSSIRFFDDLHVDEFSQFHFSMIFMLAMFMMTCYYFVLRCMSDFSKYIFCI